MNGAASVAMGNRQTRQPPHTLHLRRSCLCTLHTPPSFPIWQPLCMCHAWTSTAISSGRHSASPTCVPGLCGMRTVLAVPHVLTEKAALRGVVRGVTLRGVTLRSVVRGVTLRGVVRGVTLRSVVRSVTLRSVVRSVTLRDVVRGVTLRSVVRSVTLRSVVRGVVRSVVCTPLCDGWAPSLVLQTVNTISSQSLPCQHNSSTCLT